MNYRPDPDPAINWSREIQPGWNHSSNCGQYVSKDKPLTNIRLGEKFQNDDETLELSSTAKSTCAEHVDLPRRCGQVVQAASKNKIYTAFSEKFRNVHWNSRRIWLQNFRINSQNITYVFGQRLGRLPNAPGTMPPDHRAGIQGAGQNVTKTLGTKSYCNFMDLMQLLTSNTLQNSEIPLNSHCKFLVFSITPYNNSRIFHAIFWILI